MTTICSAPGCDKKVRCKALCKLHYGRWIAYGSLDRPPPRERWGAGWLHGGYLTFSVGRERKFAHVMIAEQVLGRTLPPGVVVHHANGIKTDNRHENLVICTQEYHLLIHKRMRAHAACGHADWSKCKYCKRWDAPANLQIYGGTIHHSVCRRIAGKKQYAASKQI